MSQIKLTKKEQADELVMEIKRYKYVLDSRILKLEHKVSDLDHRVTKLEKKEKI